MALKTSFKSYKYLKFSYKDDIDIKVINISEINWNIDHKIPKIEVKYEKKWKIRRYYDIIWTKTQKLKITL